MCLDADKLQAGQELRHPAGKGCGMTSSESSTVSNCTTRMEGPTPRRPTSEAARGRYGCIWNPEAEYRFFTVHTAVWIKTVVSITTMTSTSGHSVQPNGWPWNGAGRVQRWIWLPGDSQQPWPYGHGSGSLCRDARCSGSPFRRRRQFQRPSLGAWGRGWPGVNPRQDLNDRKRWTKTDLIF